MNRRENKNEIRLNRYLAQCGLGSRRQCDEFISAGRILVNGKKVLVL
jgi:23S rRNA pseudouridine2605 synthase